MGATKVGRIKIVFNDGRVVTHNNVTVAIKEDCIIIEKEKGSVVIIPYSNVISIYLFENE